MNYDYCASPFADVVPEQGDTAAHVMLSRCCRACPVCNMPGRVYTRENPLGIPLSCIQEYIRSRRGRLTALYQEGASIDSCYSEASNQISTARANSVHEITMDICGLTDLADKQPWLLPGRKFRIFIQGPISWYQQMFPKDDQQELTDPQRRLIGALKDTVEHGTELATIYTAMHKTIIPDIQALKDMREYWGFRDFPWVLRKWHPEYQFEGDMVLDPAQAYTEEELARICTEIGASYQQ